MAASGRIELAADETQPHQFLTYRLSRLQAKLNAQASRILGRHAGLTLTQWRIMLLIGNRGEATSAELIRLSDFDKGQFSRRLKTLIADGYVAAGEDRDDGRAHILTLTDRGRDVYAELLPRMRARQAALRAALSPAELSTFLSAIDKLEQAAEEFDREPR